MKNQKVKPPKKEKAVAPKIDLSTASQVNGNLESPSKLNDFLKKREFPYQQESVAAYLKSLESMNISDLQRHAIEVAHILPNVTDRSRLVRKLEEEYLRKQGKTLDYARGSTGLIQVTDEAAESIKKIMSRGR